MARATLVGAGLVGFDAVKFLRPVLPGETVLVLFGSPTGGRLPFACTVDGEAAVRGTALLSAMPLSAACLPAAPLSIEPPSAAP